MVILRPEFCVRVGEQYSTETYTCLRTDGRKEGGWCLPTAETPHTCFMLRMKCSWNPSGYAYFDQDSNPEPFWRVFLHNTDSDDHSCGWRPIGTFWPSCLDDDEEGRTAWIAALRVHLDALEADRPKGADPDYNAPFRRI